MKSVVVFPALLAGAFLLVGCAKKDEAAAGTPAADPGPAVATIDGKAISRAEYEFYARNVARKGLQELTPQQREAILDDLIRLHLVAETAVKNGLDKDAEVAQAMELTRLNLLTQAAVKKELATPPTEQEMRAEYETFVAAQPKYEYRARHILVQTEQYAQNLIDRINKGADFAEVARKESTDRSKSEGGDLGWFTPTSMVKQFADAVMALEKGKMTPAPVQSEYGWHIIKVEDMRDLQIQDYAELQGEMRQRVQQKKVQAYLETLKKDRKIEKTLDAATAPPLPAPG